MNTDDLEQRLRRLGNTPVTSLASDRVDEIERHLLVEPHARRASWITTVAAACAVLALVVALSSRRSSPSSLQPTTPSQTIARTTQHPEPTTSVGQSTPPSTATVTPTPTATVTETTVRTTTPSTATSAVPRSTVPLDTIPSASFALNIQRVGGELQFNWPRYSGDGATRYMLIGVDTDGLTSWPVADSQIAATTANLDNTSASLTSRGQERHTWVVAVVGNDGRLIAVSSTSASR